MFVRVVLLASFAQFSACGSVDDDPEPSVGTFTVESTLISNGCGQSGLAIPAVTELEATIRGYPGNPAQFKWTGQSTNVSGFATTSGVYSFESSVTETAIAADASLGYPGCQIVEHTAMTFTLAPVPSAPADAGVDGVDAGVTAMTLDGQITIDVSPVAGSDCTPLLGTNGGSFIAIPCQARIDLAGVRAD